MPRTRPETRPIGVNRLVALTDGVFAIVMTILVLELSVPTIAGVASDSAIGEALAEMWPELLIYALSFLVLGMFWLMHHAMFDSVVQYDFALQWLNIAYLLFVTLIPFATALFGEYGATRWTALWYGLNMLAVFAIAWAIWTYASAGHRLVSPDLSTQLIVGGRRMGIAYLVVLAVPVIVAFFSPMASFILYGLVVLVFFVATVGDRWDTVMLLSRRASTSE